MTTFDRSSPQPDWVHEPTLSAGSWASWGHCETSVFGRSALVRHRALEPRDDASELRELVTVLRADLARLEARLDAAENQHAEALRRIARLPGSSETDSPTDADSAFFADALRSLT